MPITDPSAIKFSNERARVVCNLMSQAYYQADAARDRWAGLAGTTAEKIAVMGADIRSAAAAIYDAFVFAYTSEKVWFLGINNSFPNDTTAISDGSPEDSRPAGTGAKVQTVMSRAIEFQNWMLSTGGVFTNAGRDGLAYLNTVLEASNYGLATLSDAAAGNAINRFTELATNYEASANLNLNGLLAFAVNPVKPGV